MSQWTKTRRTIEFLPTDESNEPHRITVTSRGPLILHDHTREDLKRHRGYDKIGGESCECLRILKNWKLNKVGELPDPFRQLRFDLRHCSPTTRLLRRYLKTAQTTESVLAGRYTNVAFDIVEKLRKSGFKATYTSEKRGGRIIENISSHFGLGDGELITITTDRKNQVGIVNKHGEVTVEACPSGDVPVDAVVYRMAWLTLCEHLFRCQEQSESRMAAEVERVIRDEEFTKCSISYTRDRLVLSVSLSRNAEASIVDQDLARVTARVFSKLNRYREMRTGKYGGS